MKSRKIDINIFPKGLTHGFGPKMAIFPSLFFLGNIGQENVFYDFLERKSAFLRYKNKKFKNSKNWHFSKGVNSWFWSKNGHFLIYFFKQYRQGKCLLRYSRTKNALLGYRNKKFKKSKNWHFLKSVNPWFWSKNGHFSTFFFRQYWSGKCLLRYSRTKSPFLGFKNKKFEKSKNWH